MFINRELGLTSNGVNDWPKQDFEGEPEADICTYGRQQCLV